MASLNFVQLICRVGNDPEVRQFDSGNKICTFRAATTESYTDRNGQKQEQTEWHNIVLNGKLADLAPYIYKGCLLYVGGKIRTRSWNGQDGVTHYQTEITGTAVQLLSPKREQQPQAPARASQGYSQPMPNFNPAPAPQPMSYQQPPVPQGYSPAPQMQAPMQPMADSSDPNGDLPF